MNVNVTVEGLPDLIGRFERVKKSWSDFRGATWIRVRQAFYKVEKQIFASEGADSAGGKWQSLSPPYKAWKQKKYGNMPILQASGAMYKEFTSKPGGIDETADTMTLRFSKPAGYHGTGTSKMPRRDPTDMTDAQKGEIVAPIKLRLRQVIDNEKLGSLRGF